MKIKEEYIKVRFSDGWLVISTEKKSGENNIALRMNDTASEIWDLIVQGKTEDEIVGIISSEYSISAERARAGVSSVCESLGNNGIIE